MGNCNCFKLKHHPSKVHVKTVEDIINNYLKNYHEDQNSKAAIAALPPKKKKNAVPMIKINPNLPLSPESAEQVETYAKLNVDKLIQILKIDGKFVSLMCLTLIRQLERKSLKYQMAEVEYLVLVLLKELMQTPLIGFDQQKKKKKGGI